MSLQRIAEVLQRRGARQWVVALTLSLAASGSGVPCLGVCLTHAAEASDHASEPACHHSGLTGAHDEHGADHEDCPSASPCVQDQTPGIAAHAIWTAPQLQELAFLSSPSHGHDWQLSRAGLLRIPVAPDRSPPIPPAFSILRP